MSEKKRARRRKDEYTEPGEKNIDKPSKDEIKVAKWMKKNVKTKKTKFLSHNVEYFTSSKAIDALMKSKFALSEAALFPTRDHAVEFLDIMLEHKFFHRAKKVPVAMDELRGGSAGAASAKSASSGKSKDKKEEEKSLISSPSTSSASSLTTKNKDKNMEDKRDTEAEQSGANGDGSASGNGGGAGAGSAVGAGGGGDKKEQKRKRKIRLDMHPEQIFVDGSEAYVWIYDPIPIHYWIYGLILLLGAIGICLFPLWPAVLRKGVYYLSLLAAGFLVFILALSLVRLIIFSIVWVVAGGKLHFWIFPNLTEDVGFFASFWPLYESNYVTGGEEKSKNGKKSKSKSHKRKDKDSDGEGDAAADEDATPLEPEKIEEIKEHDADTLLRLRHTSTEQIGDNIASSKAEEDSNSSEAAAESDAKG